jgi:hypothetical protein
MAFPWKLGISLLFVFGLFSACSSETAYQKGPVKTVSGTLDEKKTTWRGGAIGAALGFPVEGKVLDILDRASKEAVKDGKPTAYIRLDGFQRVEMHPVGPGSKAPCRLMREQIFQDGLLFRDQKKEVCP